MVNTASQLTLTGFGSGLLQLDVLPGPSVLLLRHYLVPVRHLGRVRKADYTLVELYGPHLRRQLIGLVHAPLPVSLPRLKRHVVALVHSDVGEWCLGDMQNVV